MYSVRCIGKLLNINLIITVRTAIWLQLNEVDLFGILFKRSNFIPHVLGGIQHGNERSQ